MLGREFLATPGGAQEFLLAEFARANGWQFAAEALPPALGESLWEQASSGVVRDRVSGQGWEVGLITGGLRTAQSVEQRGRVTVTRTVEMSTPVGSLNLGYLAVTLPRRLPHMVLDAKSNDRLAFSSLQHTPRAEQKLLLEGDFNRHFTLYVPTGYERDALYIFTPDLMALMIDAAGDLDIEIRDNQLFVYRPGGFDLSDVRTWERFERIRATLAKLAWQQSESYLDERVEMPKLQMVGPAENRVDAAGKRLRRKNSPILWIGIGIAGVAIAFAITVCTIVLNAFS